MQHGRFIQSYRRSDVATYVRVDVLAYVRPSDPIVGGVAPRLGPQFAGSAGHSCVYSVCEQYESYSRDMAYGYSMNTLQTVVFVDELVAMLRGPEPRDNVLSDPSGGQRIQTPH